MTPIGPSDETKLVLLLKESDRRAFEQIYNLYKRRIFANLRKLLHSDSAAEELLQEVFYKLWVIREQLDPEKSFSSYLFRISGNLVYDHFRKAALDKKLQEQLIKSGSELYNHLDDMIDFKESRDQLQKVISSLPPQRQKIYKLCKIEGMSYDEVALLLGVSTSTINDHIVKATKTIKKKFYHSEQITLLLLLTYVLTSK